MLSLLLLFVIVQGTMESSNDKHTEIRKRELSLQNAAYIAEMRQTLKDLEDSLKNSKCNSSSQNIPSCKTNCGSPGGATYTRWGRTTCGNESELVYEGVVGGDHYAHTGGAVNHLCLARNPIWNSYEPGNQNHAYVYGTEYQGLSNSLFSLKNSGQLENGNVPCAVCRSNFRQSAIVIPGRNVCNEGWNLEYHGYILAGHYGHQKGTMYICVDEAPEVTEAGYRHEVGNFLYFVEARCGSLPCPEYIEGREITCVVCTK